MLILKEIAKVYQFTPSQPFYRNSDLSTKKKVFGSLFLQNRVRESLPSLLQSIVGEALPSALGESCRRSSVVGVAGIIIKDPQIFASLLETCGQLIAIDLGIRVHNLIPHKLLSTNLGISSKLVRLYASNVYVDEAHELFDQMSGRNSSAFQWNALISGYADMGLYEDALALYFQIVEEDVEPDEHTFPRVLKACGGVGMIQVGEEIHRHVIRFGFGNDTFVLNSLVDMYDKCGDIVKARYMFDRIDDKDLVSWNTMIIGYFKHNLETEALEIFRWMISRSCEPDSVLVSNSRASAILTEHAVVSHMVDAGANMLGESSIGPAWGRQNAVLRSL